MQRDFERLVLIKKLGIGVRRSLIWVIVLFVLGSSLAQQSTDNTINNYEAIVGNTFFTDTFVSTQNLSVGFLHFQPHQDSMFFDGEAKVGIANLTTDAWGYAENGFEISLDSKSNPYSAISLGSNASDFWLSTSFFQDIDSIVGTALSNTLGLSGFTEFSLEANFNTSLESNTETATPFSAIGTIGYRQSFDTQLPLLSSLVTLERISVEPKVTALYDSDFTFGADVAIRADTSISDISNLSLGLEGGYTNGFWYNFTINSPIKF